MEREFNNMKDVFKVLPTTQEEKEYMIVIGKHLATTEKFPTREAAEERINSVDWNLVTARLFYVSVAVAAEGRCECLHSVGCFCAC